MISRFKPLVSTCIVAFCLVGSFSTALAHESTSTLAFELERPTKNEVIDGNNPASGNRILPFGFAPDAEGKVSGERASTVINALWKNFITNGALTLLSVLGVVMVIYSGIQYILAGSNPDQATKARQNLINVTLGVVLLISLYGILNTIISVAKYLTTKTI